MDLERRIKQEIAETVEAILSGDLSPILGARYVNAIASQLGGSFRGDEDLVAFVAVDSETDALPVDPEVRKLWSQSALENLRNSGDIILISEALPARPSAWVRACRGRGCGPGASPAWR